MKLIPTLTLIFLSTISFGQVLFNKIYFKPEWDYADAVIERKDGKYLIAGSSRSQASNDFDVNILLVDSLGNIIWDKYLGIADTLEFAFSLIETSDNNYLISGRIGTYFPYLLKFDSSGTFIWDKKFDSNGICLGGFSVGETFDTNYFFVRPNHSHNSTTLFKTNLQGDSLWTNSFDSLICFSVIQTIDSGFALAGYSPSFIDQEIKFIKTDSVGDITWTKTFGGIGNDDATSIKQLPDNGYVIAGIFDPQIPDEEIDTYIIRTNSTGDTVWTKRYFHLGFPGHIQTCSFNNGYIFSSTRPDAHFIIITKLDTLGNVQWSRQFDGNTYELGNNVTQTSDGGFLLTGHIGNTNNADMILIKLDSIGNYVISVINISKPNSLHAFAFPNPANNEIEFQLSNGRTINRIEIFNLLGEELKNENDINEEKFRMNVKVFEAGIYFFKLTSLDNHIATGKFIVRE